MPYNIHEVSHVIYAVWIVFALFWIVKSFGTKRNVRKQPVAARILYLVGLALAGSAISRSMGEQTMILPYTNVTQVIGTVLCVAGVAFAIWARHVLGANWSGMVAIKEDHELVQAGPYGIVRHPIYTGMLFAFLGTVIALIPTERGLVFLGVLILAMWIKLKNEERILTERFPEAYPKYRNRVPAALVPYLF